MSIGKKSILFFYLNILVFCATPAFADLVGQISHERVYHLGVGVSGEVRTAPAERGTRVEKNTVLLTLQDAHLQAALKAAQSALELADARFAEADRAHERDLELYDEGSLSLSELEASENNHRQLMHVQDLRARELAEQEHFIQLSRILAPEAGVVLDWSSHQGARVNPDVSPNTQILFGAGDKVLEIELAGTQSQVPAVGAEIHLIDMIGTARSVIVERIEVIAIRGVVRVHVDNPEQLPEFGTYVTIAR